MKAHDYNVGDILCNSWGYDQTNVEWFEVVALAGKSMVVLREIESRVVPGSEGFMSGSVVPVPGAYRVERVMDYDKMQPVERERPPLRKRVDKYGRVDIHSASFGRASKWDGKPEYSSHYA